MAFTHVIRWFIRLLPLLLLTFGPNAIAASITGQVLKVERGDSLVITTAAGKQRKVLLNGVAAPPSESRLSDDARRQLHMLLAGKFVEVVFDELTPAADILGRVFHGGEDINLRMIEFGLVQFNHSSRLMPEVRLQYQEGQRRAQRLGLGVWRKGTR